MLAKATSLAAAALVAAVSLSACGSERDRAQAAPTAHQIDLQALSYGPAGVGATIDEVKEAFGEPESTETPAAPAGADHMRGPQSIPLPDRLAQGAPPNQMPPMLRYRDVAFLTDGKHVSAVLVEDPDAATEEGISLGDELEGADSVYGLRCETALGWRDDDYYPACFGRIAPDRYVWFGGDPIENISFANLPLTTGARDY